MALLTTPQDSLSPTLQDDGGRAAVCVWALESARVGLGAETISDAVHVCTHLRLVAIVGSCGIWTGARKRQEAEWRTAHFLLRFKGVYVTPEQLDEATLQQLTARGNAQPSTRVLIQHARATK